MVAETVSREITEQDNNEYGYPLYVPEQWQTETDSQSMEQHQFDDKESVVSPMGERVTNAANRVVDFLNKRASRKQEKANFTEREDAHSEALEEYKSQDYNGYMDHMEGVSHSQSPEASEYATDELGKEGRRVARQEMFDAARDQVVGFGKAALSVSKEIDITVLGAGIVAGQKGAELVGNAVDTAGNTLNSAKSAVKNKASHYATEAKGFIAEQKQNHLGRQYAKEKAREYKAELKAEKTQEKSQARAEKQVMRAEKTEARAERREAMRANILERAAKAKENVAARASRFKNNVRSGAEKVGNQANEVITGAEARVSTFRAAGHAAVEAYRLTNRTHEEQNKV